MNLKAIDAALAAYREKLDEGDVARLEFFRKLWGALDEAAADAPAAEGRCTEIVAPAVPEAGFLRRRLTRLMVTR